MNPVEQTERSELRAIAKISGETIATASTFENLSFYIQQVTAEGFGPFTTQDLLVLDAVQRDEPVPPSLKDRLSYLKDRAIVEVTGRGRGAKPILSRRLYAFLGKKGVYTRRRGLDRETNKALLLRHIVNFRQEGSRLQDLLQVLPQLSRDQVQKLLGELKKERRINSKGKTNAARWYPEDSRSEVAPNPDY